MRVAVLMCVGAVAAACSLDSQGTSTGGEVGGSSGSAALDASAANGGVPPDSGAAGADASGQAGGGGSDSGGGAGTGGTPDAGCFPGTKPCGGQCVSVDDPAYGCRLTTCDPCDLANATAVCSSSDCALESCLAGFGDCNSQGLDGCETNLDADPAHCGMCGNECSMLGAGNWECNSGQCEISMCAPGTADCDSNPLDCETDTDTDVSNCGLCGNVCSLDHATAVCQAGQCIVDSCDTSFRDCDGDSSTGCEVDIRSDPAHCGGCGQGCVLPHADADCQNGNCTLVSCKGSFRSCDGNDANGCEVDTDASAAHCGGCNQACSLPNATSSCSAGACEIASCDPGYVDCDGDPANGCEADLDTDVDNCGGCGRPCSSNHVMSVRCQGGRCTSFCVPGRGNCSTPRAPNPDNGCERDVSAADTMCGGCSNDCTQLGGGLVCGVATLGQCGCSAAGQCTGGGTCNASSNCVCGGAECRPGETCSGGVCRCNGGGTCTSNQICCESGGCVNIANDFRNCGSCGHTCTVGFPCGGGECRCNGDASCDAGSSGTCGANGRCVCGGTSCGEGERCRSDGSCG